jgi:hypothetical protein
MRKDNVKYFIDLLFENKKAFTMFSLLDTFCSLLPESLPTKYSTDKLQTRLQKHYGDTIVIESQKGQGQSNISRYLFSFILIHFNHIYLENLQYT